MTESVPAITLFDCVLLASSTQHKRVVMTWQDGRYCIDGMHFDQARPAIMQLARIVLPFAKDAGTLQVVDDPARLFDMDRQQITLVQMSELIERLEEHRERVIHDYRQQVRGHEQQQAAHDQGQSPASIILDP